MSSSRPYLVRALHEWILDNNLTPYIVVDATQPGVKVPEQYVKDGQIVLNIAPSAVHALLIDNEWLEFNARFGGMPMQVSVPMAALVAIYARENGQGMVFGQEPNVPDPEPQGEQPTAAGSARDKAKDKKAAAGNRPALKVVK